MNKRYSKIFKGVVLLATFLTLSGCSLAIFNPKGEIAEYETWLLLVSAGIMLLVIVPIIIASLGITWWFRESNEKAKYRPEWDNSKLLEKLMWGIPILIIFVLSIITIKSTIDLNPKKPIESQHDELVIEVVSMDWQWLFIYPEEKIASINTLYVPVDRPLKFKLTSQGVMNAFMIPQIGTQLDVMSGMENVLYLIVNHEGEYQGASYNYSGAGYSDMRFKVTALPNAEFDEWVIKEQEKTDNPLTWKKYMKFVEEQPINAPEQYFHPVDSGLYLRVISQFLDLDTMHHHQKKDLRYVWQINDR